MMSSELYRPLNMSFMNIVLTLVLMNKGLPTMDYSNIQSFLSNVLHSPSTCFGDKHIFRPCYCCAINDAHAFYYLNHSCLPPAMRLLSSYIPTKEDLILEFKAVRAIVFIYDSPHNAEPKPS
jgi:hypothetical protein